MVRIAREKRHALLAKRIEENPFINDEELAEEFSVSVATIRLDRLALGIPELRMRIKNVRRQLSPRTSIRTSWEISSNATSDKMPFPS